MYNILIADDEIELIELLKLYFEKDGNAVFQAENGTKALEILSSQKIDCAILDVMMPEMNGFQVLKKIREKNDIPVLMLTARTSTSDKVLGLDLGADDYITKPFDPVEVVARVNTNIRRFRKTVTTDTDYEKENKFTFEDFILDTERCCLFKGNEKIEITGTEFKILKLFFSAPNKLFTKLEISEAGWDPNMYVEDSSIMVALSKLRAKLGEEIMIKNIRGLGWRLEKKDE